MKFFNSKSYNFLWASMIWGLVAFSQKVIIFLEPYFGTDIEFYLLSEASFASDYLAIRNRYVHWWVFLIRILLLGITLSATASAYSTDHALILVHQSRSRQRNLPWTTLAGLRLSIGIDYIYHFQHYAPMKDALMTAEVFFIQSL